MLNCVDKGDLVLSITYKILRFTFIACGLLSGMQANALAETVSGVAEVIDGQTLSIDRKWFRLAGVMAPDPKQFCLNKEGREYPCGRISATGLMDLVVGSIVRCETSSFSVEENIHTSVEARCFVNDYDLSEGMVYTGWALPYPEDEFRFQAAYQKAKSKKHGLWAGKFTKPWVWHQNHK
jgi:endonuclease YncB( thermonuclease family)